MNRKQEVMNLFNFMIDLLKDENTKLEVQDELTAEVVPSSVSEIIKSPSEVVDLMKRVDEITKHDSVSKTVSGLREKVGEINAKLRENEIETLQKEKEFEEKELLSS